MPQRLVVQDREPLPAILESESQPGTADLGRDEKGEEKEEEEDAKEIRGGHGRGEAKLIRTGRNPRAVDRRGGLGHEKAPQPEGWSSGFPPPFPFPLRSFLACSAKFGGREQRGARRESHDALGVSFKAAGERTEEKGRQDTSREQRKGNDIKKKNDGEDVWVRGSRLVIRN